MINRRDFISKSALAAGVGVASPSSFNIITTKSKNLPVVGHGNFSYRVNKQWGDLEPTIVPIKDCHEMVMDLQGRLIMLTNHTQNNIIIYDKSGKVLDTWTLNFSGAHGLTINQEGEEEFLYITDTDFGKVVKTTLTGKKVLELDFPSEVAAYHDKKPYKPTETTVTPNGDIYVADGYGQNYITRFDAKGKYLSHFGGKGDAEDQFDCCHGIAFDSRNPQEPQLLITSRSKQEFKKFTLDGKHKETVKLPGCWICRPVLKGENLYFAVIITKSWWSYDGMLAVLDVNDQVISLPGGSQPTYNKGVLQEPVYDNQTFLSPHDVCVDNDGNLYVPQWLSGKTYPLMLERI
jgi:peptidylamidoglycolate lyase